MKIWSCFILLILLFSCKSVSISFRDSGSTPEEWKSFSIKTLESSAPNCPLSYSAKLTEDLKDAIQHFNIKDDDMIIKLTGRYIIKSPLFLKEVIKHPEVSAFVKFFNVDTKQFIQTDSVLGLYAARASLLRYWSHLTMNYYPSAEAAFANHIHLHAQNIREINFLDLECVFADDYRCLHV